MTTHKDLKVWQQSIELVKLVYAITSEFPATEIYGLTNQMRRCSVSIPSNIAEGYGRTYDNEKMRFLTIAQGSASELETQLIISRELGFIDAKTLETTLLELNAVIKMLASLIKSLKTTHNPC